MFKHCFGPSSGPDFGLFCILMAFGHNKSQFETANDDPICVEVLMKLLRLNYNVISFAKQALLSSQQTRDDFIHNRNRNLQTSKAPLKSQAQGTSLFTSAASNQRGFPKNSSWEAQVRLPEGERMRQIRGVF